METAEDHINHKVSEEKTRLTRLFFISFVSLFLELLYIRWIPDAVHILAFFGNFTLMAVFLGLGIGLALPSNKTDDEAILKRIFIYLFVFSMLIMLFDLLEFGVNHSRDYAFNEDTFKWNLKLNIYFIVSLFVSTTTCAFIPIGQMINFFFRGNISLKAYSVNIFGSLVSN